VFRNHLGGIEKPESYDCREWKKKLYESLGGSERTLGGSTSNQDRIRIRGKNGKVNPTGMM